MNRRLLRRAVCPAAVLALAGASVVPAQTGGTYDLHWNVVAAGGGIMTGAGGYTVNGSVAQADATPAGALIAGASALHGGFWLSGAGSDEIFRNEFEAAAP